MKTKQKIDRYIRRLATGMLLIIAALIVPESILAQNVDETRKMANEKITLRISNAPLATILKQVEKKANIKIMFYGAIPGINQKTTLNARNRALGSVLEELLQGRGVTIDYGENRTVSITASDNTPENNSMVKVAGIVRDAETGETLIGATVTITDGSGNSTGRGCITDVEGKYVLELPRKASIQIAYMGYKQQSMQILKNRSNLDIALEPNSVGMDEVVVTGISKRSKNSFTGNFVTVEGAELMKLSPGNILKGLQYFDPSFKIVENNNAGSDPNAQLDFRIRGDQALGSNKEYSSMELMLDNVSSRPNVPLFVLDGFIVPISQVLELDPTRVESITILKDAAATAIYGSRAANGVVVVETKVAPDGTLSITYSGGLTVQTPDLTDYNLCNATEKLQLERMAGIYDPNNAEQMNTYNKYLRNVQAGVNTYWLSQPLRTALQQRHSLSAAGGTEVFRYSLGVNATFTPGVMKGSSNNSKSANLNMSYRLGKWNVGATVTLSDSRGDNSPYGSFSDYTNANPYYTIRNEEGEIEKVLDNKNMGTGNVREKIMNPLYNAQYDPKDFSTNMNLFTGLNLEYALMENLRFTGQISYTRGMARSERFRPAQLTDFETTLDLTKQGSYTKSTGELASWSTNFGVNYNKAWGKHLISLFGNWTMNDDTNNNVNLSATGYPNESMDDFIFGFQMNTNPSGNETTSRSMGLTGQFSYSYDNRYSLDANIRGDISSQFADRTLQPFWSVGARWNAHREKWLEGIVPNLTFRTSYGKTGSQSYSPYQAIEFYSYSSAMKPYESFTVLGALLKGLPNPSLGWATTDNFSASTEMGFWKNRINLSFSFYNNITRQMLVDYDLAPSTGFSFQTTNAGELQNIGFDLNVNVIALQDYRKELFWTIGANANHNKNRIRKISNVLEKMNAEALASTTAPIPIYQVGHSTTTLYTVRSLGIDPATGQEVFLKRNGEKTFTWDATDKVPVGDTNPKISGAFNTSLTWKDAYCTLAFTYKWGGIAYNSTLVDKLENRSVGLNADRRALTERWIKPGDVTPYKALSITGSNTPQSTRFIMDDNELAFSSINIGYRFQDSKYAFLRKCSIQALNLDFTTNDLGRLSTIAMERGLSYPFARTYTLALSIIFK